MATTYKVLGQLIPAANATNVLYTVPSTVSALVSTIMICNQSFVATTFNVSIQPSGAGITTKHYLNYNTAIAGNDTIPLTLGLTLGPTDVISVLSASGSVSFSAFGAELTLSTGEGPVISNVYITDSSYTVTTATAVALTGGYLKITGTGFIGGGAVYVDTTTATSTVVMNSNEIWSQVPAATTGTHMLMMFNPSGTGSRYAPGLSYSPVPVWISSTYSSNSATNISTQLLATGDAPLSYSLLTGSSLPSGLSLSSSGLITGSTSVGSYTFYVVVSDLQYQTATQQINLNILTKPTSVEYLVVAGGGAGGYTTNSVNGGGGAGGLLTSSTSITSSTTYTITIGAGGAGGTANNNGINSSLIGGAVSITAIGGGRGNLTAGLAGGSGGGAGELLGGGGAGTAGPPRQGYDGGNGSQGTYYGGGGGGGAGGVGETAGTTAGRVGNGGVGVYSSISGTLTGYAGGGGGAGYNCLEGTGSEGGGNGAHNPSVVKNGTSGTPNTGGGGGAGSNGLTSGSGGSGIIIVRHSNLYTSATSVVGTQTNVVNTGGYWIYSFAASGTITF